MPGQNCPDAGDDWKRTFWRWRIQVEADNVRECLAPQTEVEVKTLYALICVVHRRCDDFGSGIDPLDHPIRHTGHFNHLGGAARIKTPLAVRPNRLLDLAKPWFVPDLVILDAP